MRRILSLIPSILRLLLLLLTPLWLSLAVEGLGLRWSLSPLLSGWLHADKIADPSLVPPPGWRESVYLAANPDVAAAVRNGLLPDGYTHYVQAGRAENRPGGLQSAPAAAPVTADTFPKPTPAPAPLPAPFPALVPARGHFAEPQPAAPTPAPPTPAPLAPPAPTTAPTAAESEAAIPRILRIRTGNSGETIRMVLDLDQPPRFDPPARKPDGSLVVRLPGTRWRAAETAGRLPLTALTYRAEEARDASRLTIKGEAGVALKAIFALPPESDRGHRLVIDVTIPKPGPKDGKGKQAGKATAQTRS